MSKYAQGRFPRLAIVGSRPKQSSREPIAPSCLESPRSDSFTGTRRMAVMPKLTSGWLQPILRLVWNFLRSYFVSQPAQQRRAAVLSFRRYAVRPALDSDFTGKKPNGSVHWNLDHEAANQKGGRG